MRPSPTGQFHIARRICSQDKLFLEQAKDLTSRFREGGYCSENRKALGEQHMQDVRNYWCLNLDDNKLNLG